MTDPEPDPSTGDKIDEVIVLLGKLVSATETGTAAVAAETTAREKAMADERERNRAAVRATRQLVAAVAVVGLLLTAGLGVVGYDRITRNETTCAEKKARAEIADQRILIGVNRVSIYAHLSNAERADLRGQVSADLDKLPPPC